MALQCLLRYILLLMLVFMVLQNVRQPIFPFLSPTSYPTDTQGFIFGVAPPPGQVPHGFLLQYQFSHSFSIKYCLYLLKCQPPFNSPLKWAPQLPFTSFCESSSHFVVGLITIGVFSSPSTQMLHSLLYTILG